MFEDEDEAEDYTDGPATAVADDERPGAGWRPRPASAPSPFVATTSVDASRPIVSTRDGEWWPCAASLQASLGSHRCAGVAELLEAIVAGREIHGTRYEFTVGSPRKRKPAPASAATPATAANVVKITARPPPAPVPASPKVFSLPKPRRSAPKPAAAPVTPGRPLTAQEFEAALDRAFPEARGVKIEQVEERAGGRAGAKDGPMTNELESPPAEPLLAEVVSDRESILVAIDHLLRDFTHALRSKLVASETKYGFNGGWARHDWRVELGAELRRHVDKGDPLDVAAYCAFAWHHRWAIPAAAEQPLPEAGVLLARTRDALQAAGHTNEAVLDAAIHEVATAACVLHATDEARRVIDLVISGKPLSMRTDGRLHAVAAKE